MEKPCALPCMQCCTDEAEGFTQVPTSLITQSTTDCSSLIRSQLLSAEIKRRAFDRAGIGNVIIVGVLSLSSRPNEPFEETP